MRRSLVTTDETARHPFLASLPPHVRAAIEPHAVTRGWGLTGEDVRGFLMAYCACLLAVAAFIA